MSFNLAVILRESARSLPDKTALIHGSDRMSYAELEAASVRLAFGLGGCGVRPGDAVAVQLPDVVQFAVAYFGILKAGCVVVPMNVLFTAPEAAQVLRDSGARLLITWAGCVEDSAKAAAVEGSHVVAVHEADESVVDVAVAASCVAQPEWSRLRAAERCRLLDRQHHPTGQIGEARAASHSPT